MPKGRNQNKNEDMKKYIVDVNMTVGFRYYGIEAISKEEAIIIAEDKAKEEFKEKGADYPRFEGKIIKQ